MTDYTAFADLESVCGQWLRSSNVADGRVHSSIPAKPTFPLVVIRRVGGLPVIRQRLDRARVQLDVWAANKADARDVAEAARLAMHRLEGLSYAGAFITAVDDELGLTFLPDPETGRDRYSITFGVYGRSA